MEKEIAEQYEAQAAIQQQQLGQQQNPQYVLQQQQEIQAALIAQINPRKTVHEIRMLLEGKEFDEEKDEWTEVNEPLLNDKGVNKMMLAVKSVVNINTIMSALDEKKINALMIELMDEIIDDLTLNWKTYEIRNKADLDKVEGIVKRMAYPALMRAREGGERRFLGRVTFENLSNPLKLPSQEDKGGWLSKLKL